MKEIKNNLLASRVSCCDGGLEIRMIYLGC